ncbi:MAG TPA: hypothetical protein DDZ88_00970 [Verrucomicrobiales bacterium]|nr:hypothetical protein [Verrucomicrobiales bacterium]
MLHHLLNGNNCVRRDQHAYVAEHEWNLMNIENHMIGQNGFQNEVDSAFSGIEMAYPIFLFQPLSSLPLASPVTNLFLEITKNNGGLYLLLDLNKSFFDS